MGKFHRTAHGAVVGLQVTPRCAIRSGAQISAGATMQEHSILLEHALLPCGAVSQADTVCWGRPARQLVKRLRRTPATFEGRFEFKTDVELDKAVLAI